MAYPVIIALAVGLIIIAFIPPIFDRYKAKIIEHQNIFYNNHIHYEDLSGNGLSERISISTVNHDYSYINFYNQKQALSNVWNLKGKVNNKSLAFTDYDQDGKNEIYILTLYKDSLFLNRYNMSDKHHGNSETRFITTIPKHYENPDYDVSPILHSDLNNDGYEESVFSVYGKYSKKPRRVYCFDWANEKLLQSPPSGVILQNVKQIKDAKNGKTYFSGDNTITNYYSDTDPVPFPDSKAWLMVLNQKLEYAFDPIPFEEQGTVLEVLPLSYQDEAMILALEKSLFERDTTRLHCYNTEGKLINRTQPATPERRYSAVFQPNSLSPNQFYVSTQNDEIVLMNHDFQKIRKHNVPQTKNSQFHTTDINNDNTEEIIQWIPSKNRLTIYQSRFKDATVLTLPEIKSSRITLSKKITNEGIHLSVKDLNHWYLLSYTHNNTYFLKYVLYATIFIFLYLIAYSIQKSIVVRSLEQERTMSRLKLTTLKNQIDPHFTLNALNAIGLSILKDQKNTSYNNLQRFSQLIRNTLTEADSMTRSLEDEVQFVEDYISIMQVRYRGLFDYRFEIDEQVDMMMPVPKMIIQSFVENAINHGLRLKSAKGNLIIKLNNQKEGVEIIIEDDGIGRTEAAKKKYDSTGKGNQIISEYLSLFNKYNKHKITLKIQDLYNKRKAAGTRVIINIPENYDYKIQ
ncbi:MAG: sensor histidine kinase [Bacteroidota bacterium]